MKGNKFLSYIMYTCMYGMFRQGIRLTCNSCCVNNGITRLAFGNNIPSLRYCHHSQLIGGTRKETSHIVERLIRYCTGHHLINFSTAVEVTCPEQVVWYRRSGLGSSFSANFKWCCFIPFNWSHEWLTWRSYESNINMTTNGISSMINSIIIYKPH